MRVIGWISKNRLVEMRVFAWIGKNRLVEMPGLAD
jgi:hypothetical protein